LTTVARLPVVLGDGEVVHGLFLVTGERLVVSWRLGVARIDGEVRLKTRRRTATSGLDVELASLHGTRQRGAQVTRGSEGEGLRQKGGPGNLLQRRDELGTVAAR
jgi:hypothetical protein